MDWSRFDLVLVAQTKNRADKWCLCGGMGPTQSDESQSTPRPVSTGNQIPGLKLDYRPQLALMHALVRFAHIAAANVSTIAEIYPAVIKVLGSP